MLSAGGGARVASACHNIHHLCYSITIIASFIANITSTAIPTISVSSIANIIGSTIANIISTIADTITMVI